MKFDEINYRKLNCCGLWCVCVVHPRPPLRHSTPRHATNLFRAIKIVTANVPNRWAICFFFFFSICELAMNQCAPQKNKQSRTADYRHSNGINCTVHCAHDRKRVRIRATNGQCVQICLAFEFYHFTLFDAHRIPLNQGAQFFFCAPKKIRFFFRCWCRVRHSTRTREPMAHANRDDLTMMVSIDCDAVFWACVSYWPYIHTSKIH